MHHDDQPFLLKPIISFHFESHLLRVEIRTQRLYIRSYLDLDFEHCLSLYGDERLTKYFDYGRARSRDEIEDLIDQIGHKYFENAEPYGLFSLFNNNNMTFIGLLDLIPTEEPGTLELGCILYREFHNQGLPLEACRAFTYDYVKELNRRGFKCKGVPISKVIATAHPKNYASQRLIKNLGMTWDKEQDRFGNPRFWYSCTIPT
jgi:RimJ/RimL family protein N-acetyltransferase